MTHASQASLRTTHRTSRSLRSAARLGLGLLSLLMSAGTAAHAGTVNWDNTPGDWFANPSHWSSGAYPGAGDAAVNMSTAAMTLGQNATISSFFSNGAFTLQGGTFSGSQAAGASALTVNNVFTDNGGQISNFTIAQGQGGSVVFTGTGGNSIANSIINASLDLATNSNAYLDLYGSVTENGAITLGTTSNGIRLVDTGTVLTLGSAGSLTGFGSLYQYNANTVTNNGLVNANSSTNALNLAVTQFNNNGTAEATKGATLAFNSTNVANNGTIRADGTGSIAALTGNGTIMNGANSLFTATNGGQIQVNGTELTGMINTDANTALVFNGNGFNNINYNTAGGTVATVNGNLDLATNANAYLDLYRGVTENGAITLGTTSNGIRLVDSGTVLTLGSKGSLSGFGSVYQYNANTVTNNGLINANSKGNTLNVAVTTLNNTGTTEATNGGILTLNTGTTTNSGTLAAKSGGVVNIAGNETFIGSAGSILDGAGGTINVTGADLQGTLTGTTGTSLVFNGNGFNNINYNTAAGTVATVNTNLDLATNANAYLDLYRTVNVNSAINLGTTSNGIRLVDSGTVLNLGSAGSLTGFGSLYQYNANTVTNSGTINADSAAAPLVLGVTQFSNSGTLEATKGATLDVQNSVTNNTGTIAANGAGSVVSLTGNGIVTSGGNSLFTATNGGQIQVNGTELTGMINTDANTALVFNGNGFNNINYNTAGGTVATVNGNLDLATNANAYLDLYRGVTENGAITLGTTSNGIRLVDSGTVLTLGSKGSLSGFGSVYQYNANTVTNNGLINANSAGNTLSLGVTQFNNTGTLEATKGGTLALNNTNTNAAAGSVIAAAGAGSVVALTGNFTGTGSNLITTSGGGQIQVNGAQLLGTINTDPNTALVFNGSGGNYVNGEPSAAVINGNLDLATNANAYLDMDGSVTENGSINLGTTSNGIRLVDSGTVLTLSKTGSLSGFGSVYQYNANTLTNNGLINANSAGNTLNLSTSAFNNAGTVQVQNGAALSVSSANTDSGNVLVKQGGTATFTQGVTQTAGLTQVDGTLNSPLTLTGGTLAGTGTVVGDVANSGGTVSAGNAASPFGTLAINGAFSQGTAGVLDVGFSSTQNNLLKVSGAVTTGGLLDVGYLSADPYTGSGPFTFLNYGSLTSSITGTGPTQYFSNETFDGSGNGLIAGSNGFTYELINDTGADGLQLQVLTNGAPTPAVPEASTTVSMGLLLLLGGSGLVIAKRRRTAASPITAS